jgi:hypothetical protein
VPDVADITPVHEAMARVFPHVNVITMDLRETVPLLQR